MIDMFRNLTIWLGLASGRIHDKVPWKLIKLHTTDFVDRKYLPVDAGLEDPSDMKKEAISQLIKHWRHDVPASDLFRFRRYIIKGEEMGITKYQMEQAAAGGKKARQRRKPPVPVVNPQLDWDAEYQRNRGQGTVDEAEYRFSAGPEDVNMNDPPVLPEVAFDHNVIDPLLRHIPPPQQLEGARSVTPEPGKVVGGDSQALKKKGAKPPAKRARKKGKGKKKGKTAPQAEPVMELPPDLDEEETEVAVKPRPKPRPLTGPRPPSLWEAEPVRLDLPPSAPKKGKGKKMPQGDDSGTAPALDAEGEAEEVVSKPRPKPRPQNGPRPPERWEAEPAGLQPPASATCAAPATPSPVPTSGPISIAGTGAIAQVDQDVPRVPLQDASMNDSTRGRRTIKRKVDVYAEYEAREAAAKELKRQKR